MERANSAEQAMGKIDLATDSIVNESPLSSARRVCPAALLTVKEEASKNWCRDEDKQNAKGVNETNGVDKHREGGRRCSGRDAQ